MAPRLETATFANGCFWCTEAVFKRLEGVHHVQSGYTGGKRANPSYEQVSKGATGHAEAIQVVFDSELISYKTLLDVFWATHDPTTVNRQGYDVGTQYRSAIFYHDEKQHTEALTSKATLEQNHSYKDPIVTEIVPFTAFYPAESDHNDYYDNHPNAQYCRVIIDPKIRKLLEKFGDKVKKEFK